MEYICRGGEKTCVWEKVDSCGCTKWSVRRGEAVDACHVSNFLRIKYDRQIHKDHVLWQISGTGDFKIIITDNYGV
jgi:hypothetical protein